MKLYNTNEKLSRNRDGSFQYVTLKGTAGQDVYCYEKGNKNNRILVGTKDQEIDLNVIVSFKENIKCQKN